MITKDRKLLTIAVVQTHIQDRRHPSRMAAANNESSMFEMSGLWVARDSSGDLQPYRVASSSLDFFLSKTKMSEQRAKELRWRLGFEHAYGVKFEVLGGRLALYWNSDSVVGLTSFS